MTITITQEQAKTVAHTVSQCLALAEKSPTIAALLDINAIDIKRLREVLKNISNDIHALPGMVLPQAPNCTGSDTVATYNKPSRAHANN